MIPVGHRRIDLNANARKNLLLLGEKKNPWEKKSGKLI